ncbi:TLP18.3, Psb32 and MOLO-1 founding s of phosphatase family protein [Methyloversatilis sp. RAC08]|uniref:TPM domain-containing protein n=1 Tax=Methyloversatilis sp. RAC08 TaxID=1842540 RepID=UPI00083D7F66|nr:TPM domain-containing protein [Methyloversatilis sp. RAC08]AOF80433.1 TLP18.3, Psb32 and MOLO-1 founding s of phosphatase family protein [Methyloversatilis sp. RAC08]
MSVLRMLKHAFHLPWQMHRAFPAATLRDIEQAITASETRHAGELRFVVEGAQHPLAVWRGQTARERAIEVFSLLRIWDTAQNNGVLVYLQMADHDIEIVADRGIRARVGDAEWAALCGQLETRFARGEFRDGALECVEAVTQALARHFPPDGHPHNELPDRVVLL